MAKNAAKPFVMREDEMERLDDLHVICSMLANGDLGWAPVSAPTTILDLGCGTGTWMKEFSERNPSAQITGLDLEIADQSSLPRGCITLEADLEQEWPVTTTFDYIHTRWLVGCIFDWPKFFQQCYDHLTEGGWFEVLDIGFPARSSDGTLRPDSHLVAWNALLTQAAFISGREVTVAEKFEQMMRQVGFKNVTVVEKKLPQNAWPTDDQEKALGKIALPVHKFGHERLGHDFLVPQLNLSPEEVDSKLQHVWKEMDDEDIHAWWPIYIVYGQRM